MSETLYHVTIPDGARKSRIWGASGLVPESLDQAHSLKLELPRKLPSLRDPPLSSIFYTLRAAQIVIESW
jgi:hypothetical protein